MHMSLNDVLANDESYQKEWAFLERGIIDALNEHDDPILQVGRHPIVSSRTHKAAHSPVPLHSQQPSIH